jgi:hypothetical protein
VLYSQIITDENLATPKRIVLKDQIIVSGESIQREVEKITCSYHHWAETMIGPESRLDLLKLKQPID